MVDIDAKTIGKITSLITLILGIAIGFFAGTLYHPQQAVQAQAVQVTQPTVKEIAPAMTVPSLGTNLILAHEIAADSLVVNGFDLLKMQQGVLSYLASRPLAEVADIQNIINASRSPIAYKIKQPQVSPVPLPPPSEKSK